MQDFDGRTTGSVMWLHCRERHNVEIPDFRMDITGHYRNDAMLRQIAEAVRIHSSNDNELIQQNGVELCKLPTRGC